MSHMLPVCVFDFRRDVCVLASFHLPVEIPYSLWRFTPGASYRSVELYL